MDGAAEEGERCPFVVGSEDFLDRADVDVDFALPEVRAVG